MNSKLVADRPIVYVHIDSCVTSMYNTYIHVAWLCG